MNTEISDYTLGSYYKRKLRTNKYAYAAKKLNSQVWCSVRTIHAPMHTPGVFVLTNNESAKYWGVQSCKSPWSCPVCSARRMAKEASRIACAIDALDRKHKAGFMITFSVPHYHNFTCQQTYDILKETWKKFVHQAKSKAKSVQHDVFAQFNNEFNCEHRIRVCEFTWGHYGWHPHYHCIFFVDEDKLQEVKNWQEKLSNRWRALAKKATLKILTRDNYCDDVKTFVEKYYEKSDSQFKQGVPEAFISLDKKGNVRKVLSSHYVCGWGADKELTGNIRKKATAENHYTPYQLLEKAYQLDNKTLDNPEADAFFDLYVQYALATLGTYRTRMSPSLKKIIEEWRMTNEFFEILKKKLAEKKTHLGKWQIVCWFNEQQWYEICHLNLDTQILLLAKQINGKQLIETLLLKHQIDIRENVIPNKKFFEDYFAA